MIISVLPSGSNIDIDTSLSDQSQNPVANSILKSALDGKVDAERDGTGGGQYASIAYELGQSSPDISIKSHTNAHEGMVSVKDGQVRIISKDFDLNGDIEDGSVIAAENGKAYYKPGFTGSWNPSETDEIVSKGFLSSNNYDKSQTDTLLAAKAGASDIPDVSSFITSTVNNLTNYYLKSETYTKSQVDSIVSAAAFGGFIYVTVLPSADSADLKAIYLVPKQSPSTGNVKDEWICVEAEDAQTGETIRNWEHIGETSIDLSGYVTDTELETALGNLDVVEDFTASDLAEIKAVFDLT